MKNVLRLFVFLFIMQFGFTTIAHAQRTITKGSHQDFREGVAHTLRTARLSDNKILVTYKESSSSTSDLYAIAGTVNSSTREIAWGTRTFLGSGYGTAQDIVALSSTKAAIFFEYWPSTPDTMQYCVLDIDGTDITKGAITKFTDHQVSYNASFRAAALSNDQVVVCYETTTDSRLLAMTGTVSGTTITWGGAATFNATDAAFTAICRLSDTKFAIAYEDDDNSDRGQIRIGTVSGTTITPGASAYTFNTGSAVGALAITALGEDRLALAWEDDGDANDVAQVSLATVSGTAVSFPGNAPSFLQNVNSDLTISALSESEVIVAMSAGAGSPDSYAYCVLSGNDFSVSTDVLLNDRAEDASVNCLTSDLFVISFIDYYDAEGAGAQYGMSKVFTVASGSYPEINVQGNSIDIVSGDNTPTTADHTDFGTGATLSRTFTIQNQGAGTLTLGSNAVTITGTDAANFSVDTQPATTVSGSSSTTFVIDFASASATSHSAEIHINSDDIHERDYFFSITAEGAASSNVRAQIKVFLEGPYNSTNNEMNIDLKTAAVIPTTSPYSEDARTIGSIPAEIVDWVLVQLRSTSDGAAVVSKSALLHKSGSIVADDGITDYIELETDADDYFIVIKHRNHIAVMSAVVHSLTAGSSTLYDFTINKNKYWENDAIEVDTDPQTIYGMYAGDTDALGTVDADDRAATWNDRNKSGYENSDCKLTGSVDADDRAVTWNNRNKSTKLP